MKMIVQEDGSLLFSEPILYRSANYSQDPENPCRYIPKYEPCISRRIELRTLKCGKKSVNWMCNLTNDGISVPICRGCDKREAPDESK